MLELAKVKPILTLHAFGLFDLQYDNESNFKQYKELTYIAVLLFKSSRVRVDRHQCCQNMAVQSTTAELCFSVKLLKLSVKIASPVICVNHNRSRSPKVTHQIMKVVFGQ